MPNTALKHKPLVESIFELRWDRPEVESTSPSLWNNDLYQNFIFKYYDNVREKFPFHEALQNASLPLVAFPYVVQHRFRTGPDSWPLTQIGPGILTYNQTNEYEWDPFKAGCLETIDNFQKSISISLKPNIASVLLRYIDAIPMLEMKEDPLSFIKEYMHTPVGLPDAVFTQLAKKSPSNFTWRTEFESGDPPGNAQIVISKGLSENQPVVVLETLISSVSKCCKLQQPGEIRNWLDSAHELMHEWFFAFIEGKLHAYFNRD